MKKYTVCFIDGHSLKYKAVTVTANNKKAAVDLVFEMFGKNFEHILAEVVEHD